MECKLAYKTYPYKMSLGAMKEFKTSTGKDIWQLLWGFITAYRESEGLDQFKRLEQLTSVCDFFDASHLLLCLFKAENKCITIEEVQDAMFRVSGRPNPDDNELSHPWPLVVVLIAYEIDEYFASNIEAKKKEAM